MNAIDSLRQAPDGVYKTIVCVRCRAATYAPFRWTSDRAFEITPPRGWFYLPFDGWRCGCILRRTR
jgi:hypothetical protein